ncbi:MAG: glycosyl hydrolase 53 family protein [Agathobacter sp.]|nr:glycosyl hydrolase 53 family protein [Agathobacter sp.]
MKLDFYKGADISGLPELEDRGAVIRTAEGQEIDAFELCQLNGVNSIRLRIWNEPENVPESKGYCSLEHTVAMAKRIKAKGMHFLLDFHYSDWWADPGNQTKPHAWTDLHGEELEKAVYDYTTLVLIRLKEEGCMPDMVQVGNEIRSGMLFPDGEVPNFTQLAGLVNAGIKAVREVDPSIEIMIHLDQGGRYYYLSQWFDGMIEAGLMDFDVIGLSYYTFWHGTFMDLKNSLMSMLEKYKKPLIIAETAHPWRRSEEGFVSAEQEKIAGFCAGIQEQKHVMKLLMNIVASLPDNMGQGVYYWEPLVIPYESGSSWDRNMGVLNEKGEVLPGFAEFQFERSQAVPNEVAKYYVPEKIKMVEGQKDKLPESIQVLYMDGSSCQKKIVWAVIPDHVFYEVGIHPIMGKIADSDETFITELEIVSEALAQENLVCNEDFSKGESDWMVIRKQEYIKTEILPEENAIYVSSEQNFDFTLAQEVMIPEAGDYQLFVSYLGTNTTDVKVKLYAEQVQSDKILRFEKVIHPTDEMWMEHEIESIEISQGILRVGVEISSPPIWGKIRGMKLYRK